MLSRPYQMHRFTSFGINLDYATFLMFSFASYRRM